MLTSHAYRERLAVERYRSALPLAPTLVLKGYMQVTVVQEGEHYAGCLGVARQLGVDLGPLVVKRMKRSPPGIPQFDTWLDVLLAHALNDRAGYHVLLGLCGSNVEPYAELAARIVEEESCHGSMGEELLINYYPRCEMDEATKRECLVKHVNAAFWCLGRPGTAGDRFAVESGIKTRAVRETIVDFSKVVVDLVAQLGVADPGRLVQRFTA